MFIETHPEEIEQAIVRIHTAQEEVDSLRARISVIEDRVTMEILRERDEKDKPLYSNDTLRDIARRERLRADDAYNDLQLKLGQAEFVKVSRAARLERLKREFQIALADYMSEKASYVAPTS
jgi:hypothetical protein